MIRVKVPATTANMGPGYDVLGMALSQYSTFQCQEDDKISLSIKGLESEKLVNQDHEANLVVRSMNHLFKYVDKYPKGYKLEIINDIPLARGMGSSASAIVGGLLVANYLVGANLNQDEILKLATQIEGHPDNVAPALMGNIVLSTKAPDDQVIYHSIKPFDDLTCVIFIPDYDVSTSMSRAVLPQSISMADAVHTSGHLSLMLAGFMTGNKDLIGQTMVDRLHEPYRKSLIKNFDDFKASALEVGAFAFSLSGSGSTIIAYCDHDSAPHVKRAFEEVSQKYSISGTSKIIAPCSQGAVCEVV
ncbi:homoserine kinase [Peptostreptococcus stomatis DSM 17678]|uniref:Homoserine kinase n=1 Tax=Peptostreptococcus stomatis DSM 17678 TaxID=596315 RepID=E0E130_9FIRM|nr:homoserine kinase [Peptostreptococcus stomatis]EFM65401.1 homoserine kinase [Peptostreptococcus stomatis DSM 17678]